MPKSMLHSMRNTELKEVPGPDEASAPKIHKGLGH